MYHTGDEAFKRRLARSVALTITINFSIAVKSFIANVRKCKAHLKTNLHYFVFLSDESLLT